MKILLKGIQPEQVEISCTHNSGITFLHEGIESGKLIHISKKGVVSINGNDNITPELLGLALIQWANKYSQVIGNTDV